MIKCKQRQPLTPAENLWLYDRTEEREIERNTRVEIAATVRRNRNRTVEYLEVA